MTMPLRHLLRTLFQAALLLGLALCSTLASAHAAAVWLEPGSGVVDAWPSVTVMKDTGGKLSAEQALAQRHTFERPTGPHANLGVVREPVWLRIPMRLAPGDDGRWVFWLAYASIDRIDLYVVTDGRISRPVKLGRDVPFSQRPFFSAWHAVPLEFGRGGDHELLLRIETLSSMVLPISMAKPAAFHAEEASAQVMQGLLAGLGLCLAKEWAELFGGSLTYRPGGDAGACFRLELPG